jgi:CopG family transcriptional regulator, nickel-responsive regulator
MAGRSEMSEIVRFGVSLEKALLERFDRLIRGKHYTNRSEALRDLIRQELVTKEWEELKDVAGAITLVYDHHKRDLANRLIDVQHDFQKIIISTQHVHLDHHYCLEIIAVKGLAEDVQQLANALKSMTGVRHVTLGMTSTGKEIG